MENTSTVHVILRKDKKLKDGKCPLNLLVTLNKETFRMNIKTRRLKSEDWNSAKRKPTKTCKNRTLIEGELKEEVSKVEKFILDCSMQMKKINKDDVRDFYYGRKNFQEDFFYHFDDFTRKRFYKLAETTKKPYVLLRRQLKEFKPNLNLSDLNYTFFDNFFFWLRTEKETGNSGLATRRKNLVAVIEEFVKKDLLLKNYCKQIPRFPEKQRNVFLSLKELEKFRNTDLNCGRKTAGYIFSRELFLFGCYTGLRYGDIMELSWSNIEKGRIKKVQQKTRREVIIPLLPEAIEILNIYKGFKKEGKIFPYRANATLNRDLKIIADKAGVKNNLTFHSSRHTFGSQLALKLPAFLVALIMGHTDVRMTGRYIGSTPETLSEMMKSVSFRN